MAPDPVRGVQDAVGSYRSDGHAVVRGLVPRALLDAMEDHLATLPAGPTGIAAAVLDRDPVASTLAEAPALVGLAAAVLDGPVLAFGLSYLVKPPRSGLPALWHQDGHPWAEQLGITEAVTVWVALDESTVDSGCLWVVPGSHRGGARPLVPCDDPPNVFGWISPPELVDEVSARPVELAPGDVSVHHPALVHRSGPNRSDRRRAALAVRYRRAGRSSG